MNQAHLHLVFNHFPIIVPIVGLLIFIGGWVLQSASIKRTAYCVFILAAVCTFPATFTGEGAEEIIEHLPDISKKMIHDHEEWGEKLALLNYALGILSAIGLWASLKQKSFAKILDIAILLCALVGLFLGKQAGTSGGEIRHTEIRTDNAATSMPQENQEEGMEKDDDDGDAH